ncbi:hypothetical protein JW824_13865 [bacterium]|nr:hypothetical protein [bacterium]
MISIVENKQPDEKRFGLKSCFFLSFVSIILGLILAELAVKYSEVNDHFTRRIFSKNLLRASDNPILVYENKPGGYSTIDGVENRINLQGFRDREYNMIKPQDIFRIIVLGDSITYGLGVSWDETYPKIIEQLLNKRSTDSDQRYEVINFGVNGYNTVQEVEHLRINGVKYDPDMVLVGYNLNDVGNYSREMPYFNTWRNKSWRFEETLKEQFVSFILQHSELAFMIKYRTLQVRLNHWLASKKETDELKKARPIDYFRVTYSIPTELVHLRQAFIDLHQIGQNHNFSVLLIIFPILCDFENYFWANLHQKVVELSKSCNLRVLDLLPIFQSTGLPAASFQRRSDDFDHPNPAGHRLAANAVTGAITSL